MKLATKLILSGREKNHMIFLMPILVLPQITAMYQDAIHMNPHLGEV